MESFRPLTHDELLAVLHHCGGQFPTRDRAFFSLLFATGIQPNVALRLKFNHVVKDLCVVHRIVATNYNGLDLWLNGRKVALTELAQRNIRRWVEEALAHRRYKPWRPLFFSDRCYDKAASSLYFWRHFKQAVELSGLQGKLGLPSLRKGFGVDYLRRSNYAIRKFRVAMGYASLRNAKRASRKALADEKYHRRLGARLKEEGGHESRAKGAVRLSLNF